MAANTNRFGRGKHAMKRMLLLTVATLLVGLLLGSVAMAQETTAMMAEHTLDRADLKTGPLAPSGPLVPPLAPSGGMLILLPAAALLVGAGVLTYAVLRRRT